VTDRPDGPEVVTVFRSRLRPDAEPAYGLLAAEMESAARAMPGFVDFKTFVAEDGERASVVTFASPETHRAWRDDRRHLEAQRRGRAELYAEYSIQVGESVRSRRWVAPSPPS
jgi:heme-degrading monooxygenase HmoA